MPDAAALTRFTATHHALLFAWLVQAVLQQAGEERGIEIARRAVRRYGEQRGRRMALRARADGQRRDMLNYLVYGEWQAEAGEMEQEITASAPDLHTRVHRCPWNTAWRENGLLPYGRYYCQEIDAALLRGFNPDLKLGVGKTQTNDGEPCEFVFYEARLVGFNKLRYLAGKSIRPGKRAHLPWGYHLGHLYKTVTEVISEALNPAEGLAVEEAALAEFASRYGQPAAQIVRSYQSVDFDSLPKRSGQLAEGG